MNNDMSKHVCTECKNPIERHRIFCSEANQQDFADFLLSEMRISLQKQWNNERSFADITEQFLTDPRMQQYSVTERKVRAGQSAERKLAAANCEYYMKRATMFAAALQALNSTRK